MDFSRMTAISPTSFRVQRAARQGPPTSGPRRSRGKGAKLKVVSHAMKHWALRLFTYSNATPSFLSSPGHSDHFTSSFPKDCNT